MPTGKELLSRRDRMKNERANFDARIDKMAKFFDPTTFGVNTQQSPGSSITEQVYDSSGQNAFTILTNFLANELISPSKKYINVVPSHPAAKDDDSAKEWCEGVRDTVLSEIAKSNFYIEAPLAMRGWLFGCGSLLWRERLQMRNERPNYSGFRGLNFHCDKPGRFMVAQNANNEIDTNFREFRRSAKEADEMFPNAPSTAKFKEKVKDRPDEMCDFVHAVYPRPRGDKGYGNKGFPWASCYIENDSGELLEESGFPYYPFVNPRWDIVPGEVYGRGPVEMVYNDMMSKNLNRKQKFEAGALKNRPPLAAANDSVMSTLRWKPGGLTFFNTHGRPIRDVVQPFDIGGDLEWNKDIDNDLRQAINAGLYVDVIVQLMNQDLKDVNNYTFAKKLEILYKLLGPNYGRFEHEFLRSLFDNIVVFLYTKGLFGRPPDILLETGGSIDIEFENPLARAQQLDETNSVNLLLGDLMPWIDLEMKLYGFSSIMDRYDLDGLAANVEKTRMVPAKVIKSQQEIDATRKARVAKQQETEQNQAMMAMAEGAGKAAPALKLFQGGKDQAAAA